MLDKLNKYKYSDIYLGMYYINHMGFYIVCYIFLLIGLYLYSYELSLANIIWNYSSLWFIAIFGVFVLHILTMYLLIKNINNSNINVDKQKKIYLQYPLLFIGTIVILLSFFFIVIYLGIYIFVLTPEFVLELETTREKIIVTWIQNSIYMIIFLVILLKTTFVISKRSIK